LDPYVECKSDSSDDDIDFKPLKALSLSDSTILKVAEIVKSNSNKK